MSKWGKEKQAEVFYEQFLQDYRRFNIKPDKLDMRFSTAEEQWYDSNIPNKIVRNKAKSLHLGKVWRELEDIIISDKIFGISKAKRGSKVDISTLAAIASTDATGMVAVCDRVEGFPYINKKGTPPSHGEHCDIFINGYNMGKVDRIEGTHVKSSKLPYFTGVERESEKIPIITGVYDGKTIRKNLDMSLYKGKITLKLPEQNFGRLKYSISGSSLLKINLINRQLDLPDDEIDITKRKYAATYPCQEVITKNGKKITTFKCVNWVKLVKRKDAQDTNNLGSPKEIIML